jgi:hypothetical protein
VDTINPVIAIDDLVQRWLTDSDLCARLSTLRAQPVGGCNACRFADPFSDRLCTIPDISADDFDLGVSGINCSRFQPYEEG